MSKNIQMPLSFMVDVYRLVIRLEGTDIDDDFKSLCRLLELQIESKMAAMDRHNSFTQYKISDPDSQERETFRREYLDMAGVHDSWRSDNEIFL